MDTTAETLVTTETKTSPSDLPAAPQAVDTTAAAIAQPAPVSVPVAPAQQTVASKRLPSMPVVRQAKAEVHGTSTPLSTTPLNELLAKTNDLNIKALYEKLARLDKNLSTSVLTTPEEAAKHLADLYRVIVNVVERPSSEIEFANAWTLVMRMITETPAGGFSAKRLWRGKPFWNEGHEAFMHFEAIWNLIDASVRHRKDYVRFVNEKKVMIGFSGPAQGRLGIFYRSFGG